MGAREQVIKSAQRRGIARTKGSGDPIALMVYLARAMRAAKGTDSMRSLYQNVSRFILQFETAAQSLPGYRSSDTENYVRRMKRGLRNIGRSSGGGPLSLEQGQRMVLTALDDLMASTMTWSRNRKQLR